MREVHISGSVRDKMAQLESYLIDELKLSEEAALRRSGRMREFVKALRNDADYPLCRFKRWQVLGYRCSAIQFAEHLRYRLGIRLSKTCVDKVVTNQVK